MKMSETRNRSRIVGPIVASAERKYYGDLSHLEDESFGPYTTDTETEDMVDVVTSEYQSKINRGAIINNPCSYHHYTLESIGTGSGGFENTTGLGGWTWTGPMTAKQMLDNNRDPRTQVAAPTPELKLNGRSRCIASIDNTPYEFGEDVFELRETLRFLKNPIGSILKLSKAFKKDVYGHYKKSTMTRAKAVSQVWLEYRFAFSPLIRSVWDGLEAYNSVVPKKPARRHARHHEDAYDENYGDVDFDAGTSIVSFSCNRTRTIQKRNQIMYTVSNPVHDWRWKLGLRNKDIPSTIWQVMPYSFMVDRMFDVTSFVKGVVNLADPNVKILAASETTKVESIDTIQLTDIQSETYSGSVQGETRIYKDFTYTRDLWTPSFSDTYPKLNVSGLVDDAVKAADLVALIINNVR
jgi:hypothetical protein